MAGDLKIDKRRSKILEMLNKDGVVRIKDLSEQLSASAVTIRADLDSLEKDGFLERTTGGAVLTVKNAYKIDFIQRKQTNYENKKAIAIKVADMIPDGATLIINSGSTTYLVAEELKKRKRLNIVTNSIEVALELGCQPTFRVILLGGEINAQYAFTYGNDALEELKNYKADYAILSMDGVCSEVGLTTLHVEEAIIDRAMIDRSRNVLVVADSTKYDHEGFSFVTDFSKINSWITDNNLSDEIAEKIKNKGVNVFKAN